jgi:hypothetical protein
MPHAVQISEIALALITGKVRGFSRYLFGAPPSLCPLCRRSCRGFGDQLHVGPQAGRTLSGKMGVAESLSRFHVLAKRRGAILLFIFFLFPGFPKDLLCILLGLTGLSLKVFMFLVLCLISLFKKYVFAIKPFSLLRDRFRDVRFVPLNHSTKCLFSSRQAQPLR